MGPDFRKLIKIPDVRMLDYTYGFKTHASDWFRFLRRPCYEREKQKRFGFETVQLWKLYI